MNSIERAAVFANKNIEQKRQLVSNEDFIRGTDSFAQAAQHSYIKSYSTALEPRGRSEFIFVPEEKEPDDQIKEFDPLQYLPIFFKRKWSIVFFILFSLLMGASVLILIKPIYRSTATLLIEPENAKLGDINNLFSNVQTINYYATQYELLKSRGLIEQVKERLSLDSHEEFKPLQEQEPLWLSSRLDDWGITLPEWLPIDRLLPEWLPTVLAFADSRNASNSVTEDFVDVYLKRLTIAPIKDSQLVNISFEAHDAELAANVANEHGKLYIENDIQSRLRTAQNAIKQLTERLPVLRTQLKASEAELQSFRERENLLEIEGVRTLATAQLNALSAQLVAADQRLLEIDTLYQSVRKAADQLQTDQRPALPTILKEDEILKGLLSKETTILNDLNELEALYSSKHPAITDANIKLAGVRSIIDQRIKALRDQVRQDYNIAAANRASVAEALDLAKTELREINRKEFKLNELERKVETNRNLVNTLERRIAEIDATEGIQTAKASIVNSAVVAATPITPDRKKILLIALVGGIMLGIGWSLLREYLDKSIKRIEDIEDRLHLPMLGFLPRIKPRKIFHKKANKPELYFRNKPRSTFAEAIRNIRTNVLLSCVDDSRKIIVVTSPRAGEGKSVLALNLACALAENGKVLIMDADMRKPSLGTYLEFDKSANGLSHHAAGLCSLSECIYTLGDDSNISFIPAGIIPPNPLSLLSSQRFANLIETLKKDYNSIVIDCPPLLAVSDTVILSNLASGVILVARSESTPYKLAQDAIRRLSACKAPLLGAVLNDFDIKRYLGHDASYGYGTE